MQRTFKTRDGRTFISHDYLCFSDYSGCAVERANVKVLSEDKNLATGSYRDIPEDGGPYEATRYDRPTHTHVEDLIEPDVDGIVFYGGHGTEQLYLLDTPENREAIDALDGYPAVSDEAVSDLETEIEDEAWDNWLRDDLLRTLPDELDDNAPENALTLREHADSMSGDLRACFHEACEATGTYPEVETGGNLYVDIDRIREAFQAAIETRITDKKGTA